jgi:hypothetical protein
VRCALPGRAWPVEHGAARPRARADGVARSSHCSGCRPGPPRALPRLDDRRALGLAFEAPRADVRPSRCTRSTGCTIRWIASEREFITIASSRLERHVVRDDPTTVRSLVQPSRRCPSKIRTSGVPGRLRKPNARCPEAAAAARRAGCGRLRRRPR